MMVVVMATATTKITEDGAADDGLTDYLRN